MNGLPDSRVRCALLCGILALAHRSLSAQEPEIQSTEILEFEAGDFAGPMKSGFFVLPADGGEAKPLGRFPQLASCGSPAYSPDGKRVAFDAIPAEKDITRTQLVLMNADGSDAYSLGDGLMPSWSPSGDQIACGRYKGGSGVWVYDVATRTPTLVEANGWGIQWSPDGKYQAYMLNGALVVRNVETGQKHEHAGLDGWQYNYAWSPDSKRLCGVATLPDGRQAVVIARLVLPDDREWQPLKVVEGEYELVATAKENTVGIDVSWRRDGVRIAISHYLPSLGAQQIWEFNPETLTFPWPIAGQSKTNNYDHCWSPDGKTLLYVGRHP
jgi:TolB protein